MKYPYIYRLSASPIIYSTARACFVPTIIYVLVNIVNVNRISVNYLANLPIYNVNSIVYNKAIK
nr:MAG TPA: protein of unknown function DUF4408 [Caudoviricetes sp.]